MNRTNKVLLIYTGGTIGMGCGWYWDWTPSGSALAVGAGPGSVAGAAAGWASDVGTSLAPRG